MKKIISMLLPVIALAGGVVGGDLLGPGDPAAATVDSGLTDPGQPAVPGVDKLASQSHDGAAEIAPTATDVGHDDATEAAGSATFTFPSQFFVPMMRNGDMGAIMILTLSLQTSADELEPMKQHEHRLRDALLRQLLVHANTGGFDGNFTSEPSMRVLRESLLSAAKSATALTVSQVLIEDIARQGR